MGSNENFPLRLSPSPDERERKTEKRNDTKGTEASAPLPNEPQIFNYFSVGKYALCIETKYLPNIRSPLHHHCHRHRCVTRPTEKSRCFGE